MRHHPMAMCEQCPLYDEAGGNYCPSDPIPSGQNGVAIVSRSPGPSDPEAGHPMSGPTGQIVDHLLQLHGHPGRAAAWVTNVVSCTCEKVPADAIKACRPRLEAELADVNPPVVILAAAEAVRSLLGGSLADHRGQRLTNANGPLQGRLVVASPNPAVVLREAGTYPDLVNDFRRALRPARPYVEPSVSWIGKDGGIGHACADIATYAKHAINGGLLACDIETTGLSLGSELVTIAFGYRDPASKEIESFVIDLRERRHPDPALGSLLRDNDIRYLWHNGLFDTKILNYWGYDARIDEDSMLLSYCLDERQRVHSLDYLIQNELDWPLYESEEVKLAKKNGFAEEPHYTVKVKKYAEKGKYKGATIARFTRTYPGISDFSSVYRYNGLDTAGSYHVARVLGQRVQDQDLEGPYRRLLIPGANALRRVESRGILIERERADSMVENDILPRLRELQFIADVNVGHDINLNSPKQVSEYVYDILRLRDPLFRPDKIRSVDAANREAWLLQLEQHTIGREVSDIEAYIFAHPELHGYARAKEFLVTLDEYKKLDKLRGTYFKGLLEKVDADGRLRTSLLLHGTTSGRLSSSKPNLQNIPRYDPSAKYPVPNVKTMFVADPGNVLIQADFSQAELRTAAVLAADEHMQDIYTAGRDFHSEMALAHYGEGYTKEQRVRAKTCNFAMLYGAGAYKLAQLLHVPESETKSLIRTFWRQFPQLKKWVAQTHKGVRETGECQSPFGRKRRFPILTDQNLDEVYREASNFYVQSTASDFCLWSLIELVKIDAPVWLAVHDSILLEVPEQLLQPWAAKVKVVMESAPGATLGWTLPFTADVQWGRNWGELHDLHGS